MRRRQGIACLAVLAVLCKVGASAAEKATRAQRFAALPDWSGIWVSDATEVDISGYPAAGLGAFNLKLVGGKGAPVRPELRARVSAQLASAMAGDAKRKAQGWGYPLMMEGIAPMQFLVTPEETLILNFYRDLRHVYTDARKHLPEDERWPVPWGDSVGHWEGDTLVIDTVSVQLDAIFPTAVLPLTENAHFEERLRRTGPDHMELQMRIEDPQVLSEPWVVRFSYKRAKGLDRLIHNAFDNDRSEVEGDSLTIAPPKKLPATVSGARRTVAGFGAGRFPDFPGRIDVHRGDAEAHQQVGPTRDPEQRDQTGRDDGEVGEGIIACRQEGRLREAASRVTMPRQQQGTGQVDDQRAAAGEREQLRIRRQRRVEFLPRGPRCGHGRHQQQGRQQHAHARASLRRPGEGEEHQQIDGRVLEEVDAVREQRDRADVARHREFDEKYPKFAAATIRTVRRRPGVLLSSGCIIISAILEEWKPGQRPMPWRH